MKQKVIGADNKREFDMKAKEEERNGWKLEGELSIEIRPGAGFSYERPAALYESHIGEVYFDRDGDDMLIYCRKCKGTERVPDYEHGARPRKFTLFTVTTDGKSYSRCHGCGFETEEPAHR